MEMMVTCKIFQSEACIFPDFLTKINFWHFLGSGTGNCGWIFKIQVLTESWQLKLSRDVHNFCVGLQLTEKMRLFRPLKKVDIFGGNFEHVLEEKGKISLQNLIQNLPNVPQGTFTLFKTPKNTQSQHPIFAIVPKKMAFVTQFSQIVFSSNIHQNVLEGSVFKDPLTVCWPGPPKNHKMFRKFRNFRHFSSSLFALFLAGNSNFQKINFVILRPTALDHKTKNFLNLI